MISINIYQKYNDGKKNPNNKKKMEVKKKIKYFLRNYLREKFLLMTLLFTDFI